MELDGRIFSLLICSAITLVSNFEVSSSWHKVKTRSLIFPVTAPTRIQFIGGIGIPVEDLAYESITSGYVLKAEYFLPSKAEQLRPNYLKPQLIHRRSATETEYEFLSKNMERGRQNVSTSKISNIFNENTINRGANFKNQHKNGSTYRWIIYKSVEMLLDRAGQPGHTCLLRSICEHAALPLNYESGILAEILHIILTPSTSNDDVENAIHRGYLRAELIGREGASCERVFKKCTISPMDQITTIIETNS